MSDRPECQLLALFMLGETVFALDALQIQEIIRFGAIRPVHHAPKHLLGIINLRGRLVSIVDPSQRLGLDRQQPGEESRVLVVDWMGESIGILVSKMLDVFSISPEEIESPPPNLQKRLGAYLVGVMRFEGHMAPVLDMEALLSVEETV